jgi:hypothetical protein
MQSKKFWAISALVVLVTLMAGCKENKSTNAEVGVIPDNAVGTWRYQSATINGEPTFLGIPLDWMENTVTATITMTSEGDYHYVERDTEGNILWQEDGTITASEGDYAISITSNTDGTVNPPEVQVGTYSIAGPEMTLTTSINDQVVVFELILLT